MRLHRLLTYFTGLMTALTFASCQDPAAPAVAPGTPTPTPTTATRFRVKKLSQDLPNNSAKISSFNYDAQGRLSAVVAYQSPDSSAAQVERNTYRYDGQNRLIFHQRQVIAVPGSIFKPFSEQNQFSYDAAGNVSEIRYSLANYLLAAPNQTIVDLAFLNDAAALAYVVQLRYNATNQLIGSTKINYFQGNRGSITSVGEYAYSSDKLTSFNVVTTSTMSSAPPYRDEGSLRYDSKINPFYGVYVVPTYFGGVSTHFPNLNTLSRNNITNIGGVTFRHDYNAADLPTVRYTTIGDNAVETLRFEYESY